MFSKLCKNVSMLGYRTRFRLITLSIHRFKSYKESVFFILGLFADKMAFFMNDFEK